MTLSKLAQISDPLAIPTTKLPTHSFCLPSGTVGERVTATTVPIHLGLNPTSSHLPKDFLLQKS